MAKSSRTKKSAINSSVGIIVAVINSLLSFALNAVFIRLLGLEYAGINSLFSSILNLLNIADLGISNAILFRLYKKIADDDYDGICLMLTTYKRICFIVASIILVAGLCCIPFLGDLVKEKPTFPESLWSLFIIVLATSVVSHAFDYTRQMLVAKQDQYINTIVNYVFKFLTSGLQIFVLFVYKDIYLYLIIALVTTIAKYIVYSAISHRRYKVLWNSKEHISKPERKELVKDTGSLAVYKLCRTLDATIDTFLIAKFVAVATTAIYGSVNVIIAFLEECFGNINDGMIASIGDLNARGEKDGVSKVFYQSMHFTYLVFGIITVTLVPLLSPLVQWWIGYTLTDVCIYVMILNFFMGIFGSHVAVFRNSIGIFKQGWRRPIFTAILNLVFSLWLVTKLGLIGTLLGTTIARILTTHWYDPMLVCKHGFNEKPFKYYSYFILYIVIVAAISYLMIIINKALPEMSTFLDLVWHGIVCATIAAIAVISIGFLFPEQKPLFKRIMGLIKKR